MAYQLATAGQGIAGPLVALTPQSGGPVREINPGFILWAYEQGAGSRVLIQGTDTKIEALDVDETFAEIALLMPMVALTQRQVFVGVTNEIPFITPPWNLQEPQDEAVGGSVMVLMGIHGVPERVATVEDGAEILALIATTSSATIVVREDLVADGLVQGGAPISAGTTLAVVTGIDSLSNNVAATLPDGVEGMRIEVQAARRDFVAGALNLFPALGDTFYGNYLSNQPMLIAAGHTASLAYRDGAWMDDESADTSVSISAISPPANELSLLTTDNVEYMNLGDRLLDMVEAGLKVSLDDVTVTGTTFAAAVPVESVVHHVTVCPTDLFAIRLRGEGNMRWIYNATLNTLGVYPGLVTESINGTVASPTVAPGQVRAGGLSQAIRDTTGNWQLREIQPGRPLALTAFAGGGQASATVISAPAAVVSVCATNGDSLKLANDYQKVTLSTGGITTQVAVFPPSGGAINGAAANASVILPGRCIVTFTLIALNQWAMSIDLGPQSGVAKAGGGAAFATPIIGGSLIMGTVATANDSFILNSVAPRNIFVSNPSANASDVFPPTGGTINALAVDTAFSAVAGTDYLFYSNNGVAWFTKVIA